MSTSNQATAAPDARPTGLRLPSARTWFDVAVLVVLIAVGVLGFEASFGGFGFVGPAFGGLIVGAATAIVASMLRLAAVPTALASFALYFLFGTAIAVPSQGIATMIPSLESLTSLAIGAVYGWADIVTLLTPIGAPEYITVVPYVATWLVALVSVTLATRWLSQRPRTAWRFAVTLLGPFALYLASILLGTDEPAQAGPRGIAFAAIALIWLGWRRELGDSVSTASNTRLRNRKLVGTAVVVIASILIGGGAGLMLAPPKDQRFVLRDEIEPPFDPLQYPSPLSGFRHFTKQVTDDVQFTVSGLREGDLIRMATLDSFNGKLWNVTGPDTATNGSGSFSLVGRSLPNQTFVTPEVRRGVTFEIDGYNDVWIPSVGYPTDIVFTGGEAAESNDNLRYNAATGSGVLTSGLNSGDSYTVDAVVQRAFTAEDLRDVSVASVELPPVESSPDVVTVKAQEFAASATDPAAQLEAIRIALVSGGFLSHGRASDTAPSRAGHGADRITDLLERNQMIGDDEQYASAFALMARSLGYPARVVMGFAPEITDGEPVAVTGDDVAAWVEVAFDDVGWVAFKPTPDETDIPQDQTPKPQSEPQPQVRQPPRLDNEDEDLLSPVELEESEEDDEELPFELPAWVLVTGISILAVLVVIFIPMLIIGLIKAQRMRRRRRAAATHDRVAGAWDELVDRYSELGYSVPSASTRKRVAETLEGQASDASLAPLAVATDDAVFSGRDVDPETAERVWTEAEAAVAVAQSNLSRMRRFLARYRIRSVRDWVRRSGGA